MKQQQQEPKRKRDVKDDGRLSSGFAIPKKQKLFPAKNYVLKIISSKTSEGTESFSKIQELYKPTLVVKLMNSLALYRITTVMGANSKLNKTLTTLAEGYLYCTQFNSKFMLRGFILN